MAFAVRLRTSPWQVGLAPVVRNHGVEPRGRESTGLISGNRTNLHCTWGCGERGSILARAAGRQQNQLMAGKRPEPKDGARRILRGLRAHLKL